MPTRNGYPEGTPSWADLTTTDVQGAKRFYAALFGWQFAEAGTETNPYSMALQKGLSVAGIGPVMDPSQPPVWTTYFAVDDADTTAAKITDAGGEVFMPPYDVMGAGRMAMATDPSGAVFGIWQAKEHFGAAIVNEHGALNWNELLTDDLEGAFEFYSSVFGHTIETSDMPSGPYSVFSVGNRGIAGAMAKPMPEIPNHWGVYFAVDDASLAIETTRSNGGSLSHGPMDIAEVGTFAGLVDPFGAHFTVIQLAGEVD